MQGRDAFERAAGLFEEPRIAVPRASTSASIVTVTSPSGCSDLPLPFAGPLLLAAFIRAYGFAEQMFVAGQQPHALPFEIVRDARVQADRLRAEESCRRPAG